MQTYVSLHYKVKPSVARHEVPSERAAQAHRIIESRENHGKAILWRSAPKQETASHRECPSRAAGCGA